MNPEEQNKFEECRELRPRRALIVTPSSTKAMDVSGGVAKVINVHRIISIFLWIYTHI